VGFFFFKAPGDKQHIAVGVKHRFSGIEESEMIEFSTHHREDDSYRDVPSGKIPDAEFHAIMSVDSTAEHCGSMDAAAHRE
jgi:hypothetical protein